MRLSLQSRQSPTSPLVAAIFTATFTLANASVALSQQAATSTPTSQPFEINGEFLTRTNRPLLTLQRDPAGVLSGLELRQELRQEISKGAGPVKKCVETLTLTLSGKIAPNAEFKIAPDAQNRAVFTHSCAGEPQVTHTFAGTAKVTELAAPDEVGIFGIEADIKSTTGKAGTGLIQTIGFDAKTKHCPKAFWEFCTLRGMELQTGGDVKTAELLYGLTCPVESSPGQPNPGQTSIEGCMLLSRMWAARGQTDKARDLRRKSCSAQPEFCWRLSMMGMFMDTATVADLTPVLCKFPPMGGGLQKNVLAPMCKLGDNVDFAKWAAFLSKTYKAHESRLAALRTANRGKPVKLDFVANPALWAGFSRDLKAQKFPVRVRFPVSGVDSMPMPSDVGPVYGQLVLSTFKLGYLGADLPALLQMSVKYPSLGGFGAAATGTVIGYKNSGATDLPVIVLD